MLFQVEAEVRWLDQCEAMLVRARPAAPARSTSAEPTPVKEPNQQPERSVTVPAYVLPSGSPPVSTAVVSPASARQLGLVGVASLIAISAAGIATGLAVADGRPDPTTLGRRRLP